MLEIKKKATEASAYLQTLRGLRPDVGLILGSGLGQVAEEIEDKLVVPYGEIPHMPQSTVAGHAGCLVLGQWCKQQVACFQGRFHYYEGYSMSEVTFPVRLLAALGAKLLFITNAAGGMNPNFCPGDIMLITDHINFMGANPLIGANDNELGPRFPSMAVVYDSQLASLLKTVAAKEGVELKEGVYIGVSGPNFETPAELGAFARWGADAVGMSTVPEVIVASHANLRVLAMSVITNIARGEAHEVAQHGQVLDVAGKAGPTLARLLRGVCARL
ncbi:MAG: purine-nucleoside phosphorylase [bacterium]